MDDKKTPVVSGMFAVEVREAIRRARLGKSTSEDAKLAKRSEKIKQEYDAVWK